jgi:hypothetical protein
MWSSDTTHDRDARVRTHLRCSLHAQQKAVGAAAVFGCGKVGRGERIVKVGGCILVGEDTATVRSEDALNNLDALR